MPDPNDWKASRILEFAPTRAVLAAPSKAQSGRERVTPMMYLPDERDDNTIYVFASKGAGFAKYAALTNGIRTIPVLSLQRSRSA